MITRINNVNSENYRILYEKATRDLMAYNEDNELVRPSEIDQEENRPLIMPEAHPAEEIENFESGKYCKWNEAHKRYEVAEEDEPVAGETYYTANDITSLNEYFSYIKNLASINPIYTVLPLDEGTFDVDLNTREISVPDHFAKNGISVQGDEVAEVVYFKVNRFFDAQDLAHEDIKIYIQWKCAKQDENGTLIEGVSVPWVVDLETEPNYILFGWPISSKITAEAGEIQFAVRFFKFKDRKIVYSLSTLTQKVKVQPSLDFNIAEQLLDALDGTDNSSLVVDDNTLMILNRLENSEVIDGGVRAEKPFFFVVSNPGPNATTLTTPVDEEAGPGGEVSGVITSVGLVPEFWLAENPDPGLTGLYDTPTTFKVQGSSHDAGRVSYSWRKFNIDTKEPENITFGNKFLETEDTEAQLGKVYYKKVVNGESEAYQKVSTPVFDQDDDEYEGQLYERFSVANITGVGYYAVTIQNRVQNSVAKKDSITMVVSMPVTATIETPVEDRGYLKAEEEYTTTLSVGAVPRDNSYLTYQWYYNKTGEGGLAEATPIEGATAATYEIVGSGTASAENGAEGDGYYYVIVTSNMNGSQVTIEGNEAGTRVTHMPVRPRVTIPDTHKQRYNINEVQLSGGMKVVAELDPAAGERRNIADGDAVTYQWYRYSAAEGHTVEEDAVAARENRYEKSGDVLIEGATDQVFVPTIGGYYYYCIATNHYNNETTDGYSPFFEITLV